MATSLEIRNDIEKLIAGKKAFKIGKTGKTPRERYEENEEYRDGYDEIHGVCFNVNAAVIDELEVEFIKYFKNHATYGRTCNNEIEHVAGDMGNDSEKYYVYVVVKN